ncbi:glycosyl hydrolase [Paenibacillus sp. FSL R7-0302]|uniref:glycosyl hydrolase n=1 Tax=Paenibacillus sp. FSL R7-0302 TaxID=2921681 RepID=UPI0030FCB38C
MNTNRKYRLFTTVFPLILILSLLPWGEGRSLPADAKVTTLAAPAAAPIKPINPSASKEASALLSYLHDLSGKGMISGQHDYLESPDEFNNKLRTTTGRYAVLHGYELGAIGNQSKATIAKQRQAVVDSAIRWHKGGGIVAMTFHQNLPGTAPVWTNVQKPLSQNQFKQYVTPGTPQYKALIAELDEVAKYLGELRDAGVPVLWRPYHEMNGGWFWWGQKDDFVKLWDLVYDRMVNTHKLNNLLWVWNPNAPNKSSEPYAAYFPGTAKVDILAADIYDNDFKQSYYDSLLKLADGKPIGIGESGELPDPVIMSQKQSKWVYTMTWGKMLVENNPTVKIQSFMNHKYTVSREDYKLAAGAKTHAAAVSSRNGLRGQYYGNMDLSGTPLLTRNDSTIQFNWHGNSPASGLPKDSFSVCWTGTLKPLYSEKYTFTASSDDGIRVWIGGKLLIDSWKNQSSASKEGSITLSAGTPYAIKVEYYENRGDASVSLMWRSQSQKQMIIPQSALTLP